MTWYNHSIAQEHLDGWDVSKVTHATPTLNFTYESQHSLVLFQAGVKTVHALTIFKSAVSFVRQTNTPVFMLMRAKNFQDQLEHEGPDDLNFAVEADGSETSSQLPDVLQG